MPRPGYRACLNDGLRLDLNRLAARGIIRPGSYEGSYGLTWTSSYWGELASASIMADMTDERSGWLKVTLKGDAPQTIHLTAQPRRFGGRQWYFVCPTTGRRVSVVWRPPGATRFASRHAWGPRRVAYRSQFLDRTNRAHFGQSKIKNRLIGDLDPDAWALPPKPKWMRWRTYQRVVDRFDHYEDELDSGLALLAAKFMGRV